eukprot:scaffold248_cov265-Pinguiococcus_pyrenoidosus.AAC.2
MQDDGHLLLSSEPHPDRDQFKKTQKELYPMQDSGEMASTAQLLKSQVVRDDLQHVFSWVCCCNAEENKLIGATAAAAGAAAAARLSALQVMNARLLEEVVRLKREATLLRRETGREVHQNWGLGWVGAASDGDEDDLADLKPDDTD